METLKRLGAGFVLMLVLSMVALAGETNAPPCAPGETNAPPCSASQPTTDNSTTPAQTETPPASNAIDVVSISEIVCDMLMVF